MFYVLMKQNKVTVKNSFGDTSKAQKIEAIYPRGDVAGAAVVAGLLSPFSVGFSSFATLAGAVSDAAGAAGVAGVGAGAEVEDVVLEAVVLVAVAGWAAVGAALG